MKHTLPLLPYAYDALEPYIDARTMEIHHTKHHQAYIDKFNAVLEKHPELSEKPLTELLANLESFKLSEADYNTIRNHGGGHANHSFFWTIMGPKKEIDEQLVSEVTDTFGSVDEFKKQFTETASGRFGSGWAWLVRDETGKLEVYSTANQDSPAMSGHKPLIGLDVWEHAYYIKYKWERTKYIENWWHALKLI